MKAVRPAGASLTVASVLGRDPAAASRAVQAVAEHLGPLCFASEPLPFPWTDYYRDELGDSPVRRIVALQPGGDASGLAAMKRATCRLEVALGHPGQGRRVNIDPGVLDEHQLVLASTKHRAHRIYVGQGIFADLMLLRQEGRFAPLPWTYPDYADGQVCDLFERLRSLLLTRRRVEGEASSRGGQTCTQ